MRPKDVESSVIFFRYLRDHFKPIDTFGISRGRFATYLVVAPANQVEFGIGDAMRHIEETAVPCRELLDSDIPKDPPRLCHFLELLSRNLTRKRKGAFPGSHLGPASQEAMVLIADSYALSVSRCSLPDHERHE